MRRRKRSTTWRHVARSGCARLVFGLIIVGVLGVTFWPQQSQQTVPSQVGQSIDNDNTKVALSPAPAVAPFDAEEAKQHQQAWADHLGVSVETTNSIGMKFVVIPPGEFMMGSSEDEPGRGDDETLHKVTLTEPFQMGMHEVTQDQYERVMGVNPSRWKGGIRPVENIGNFYHDATEFCVKLSEIPAEKANGRVYRLPTEAEWENACRAGTISAYSFGDSHENLGDYAWCEANAGGRHAGTHSVGVKKPNQWGLYDMLGNLGELCHDRYADYPSVAVSNPAGPASGSLVYRGGSCEINYNRSAQRFEFYPGIQLDNRHFGFRVVYTIAKSVARATKAKPSNEPVPQSSTLPPIAVAPFDSVAAKAHQAAWAEHLGTPVETTNSIGMKFAVIPAGEFTMGSNTFEDSEKPTHKVTLTQPFQLGMYEVTQEQYAKVVGTNPSKYKGSSNPVEQVNWSDAVAFCKLLSDLPEEKASGYVYRLPTEAEWEHACRAGTTSDYSFGDSDSELGDYAWYDKNSGKRSHPVGEKKPNVWDLYDMHGNVWEWCHDRYGDYPSGSVTDPIGPASGDRRVLRGGSFFDLTSDVRSANRLIYLQPDFRLTNVGFRPARTYNLSR